MRKVIQKLLEERPLRWNRVPYPKPLTDEEHLDAMAKMFDPSDYEPERGGGRVTARELFRVPRKKSSMASGQPFPGEGPKPIPRNKYTPDKTVQPTETQNNIDRIGRFAPQRGPRWDPNATFEGKPAEEVLTPTPFKGSRWENRGPLAAIRQAVDQGELRPLRSVPSTIGSRESHALTYDFSHPLTPKTNPTEVHRTKVHRIDGVPHIQAYTMESKSLQRLNLINEAIRKIKN